MPVQPLILVAEDQASDQFLLTRAVDRAGVNVRLQFVNDGLQVIERLQSQSATPAALLLDLNMPAMDGFQVLEWLRQNRHLRPAYVVVLSASLDRNHLRRACDLGVDHYLVKPSDANELVATLKRLEPYWCEATPRTYTATHQYAHQALAAA